MLRWIPLIQGENQTKADFFGNCTDLWGNNWMA